jgi:hypothetical protein
MIGSPARYFCPIRDIYERRKEHLRTGAYLKDVTVTEQAKIPDDGSV